MTKGRAIAPLMVTAAIVVMAFGASTGARLTLALMTGSASVSGNTFTTGTWAGATTWYLHNAPTPPVGPTMAQFNLGLDATAPSATTLYNYDTNCDSRAGRTIRRGGGLVTEAGTCLYATWRSTALPATRILTGTATLTVWARKTSANGTNPTLRAYLRVFDPATSTYVELGNAGVVVTSAPTAWASYALTWSLASVPVSVGRQIEVKIVATGNNRDPEIAYDTKSYPASLQLP
jgi:hypothetical protein